MAADDEPDDSGADETLPEDRVSFVDCTCAHEPDDHGWTECVLDGCPCKGHWEE